MREREQKKHKMWQLQEAKAKFSQLIEEVTEDGYRTITRNGKPVAIVISKKDFDEYLAASDSLVDFFLKAPFPEVDLDTSRDKDPGRKIDL